MAAGTASSSQNAGLVIKINSIVDDYEVQWDEKLGCGISGPVRPCRSRATGEQFALKCLPDQTRARQEVQLQYKCQGHPHIVNIYDVYANKVRFPAEPEPKSRLLVVMELMEGGELFERISKYKYFTEFQAANYTRQIALAIQRCHSMHIAHRDLKPENLLLKDKSEDAVIKLSDFGFAKIDEGNLKTPNFTPYFVAPQVLQALKKQQESREIACHNPVATPYFYDKSCDMWSLGVIVYIMLCGYPPFYSEVPNEQLSRKMKKRIMAGHYEFPSDDWSFISSEAIDLVSGLLKVDPLTRLDVDQTLNHPWLVKKAPMTQLLSAAILSDKSAAAEMNEAHEYQLTTMRLLDKPVTLKPMKNVNNPILNKRCRQLTPLNVPPAKQPFLFNPAVQSIQDVIVHCRHPVNNKPDNLDKLIDLVSAACKLNSNNTQFMDGLAQFHWNGQTFPTEVNRAQLAERLSELLDQQTEHFDKNISKE